MSSPPHKLSLPGEFPWTHPANGRLVRDNQRGALPKTDDLLDRSVICPVPSKLAAQQEQDCIATFRAAWLKESPVSGRRSPVSR